MKKAVVCALQLAKGNAKDLAISSIEQLKLTLASRIHPALHGYLMCRTAAYFTMIIGHVNCYCVHQIIQTFLPVCRTIKFAWVGVCTGLVFCLSLWVDNDTRGSEDKKFNVSCDTDIA